jgi:NAD-dependent SIR2 family protein deacetylase
VNDAGDSRSQAAPRAVPERAARQAAAALDAAAALLITAGAGMGVDSGLPDFRGDEGFWRAYPPFRALGLSFVALANPRWFRDDPHLAWGFYGHRFNLYRATRPHDGFARLLRWGAGMARGAFVFTSNVDGHFQRAGFAADRVVECHGSLDVWQCTRRCAAGPFVAPDRDVPVDPATFRAAEPLPACPGCGALARPNVLLFGDGDWDGRRSLDQQRLLGHWLDALAATPAPLAIVECGAGTAVPTVRAFGEAVAAELSATLIRINVREPEAPSGAISIAAPARAALTAIDAYRARR